MRDADGSFDKNTSWDWRKRLFQDIKAMSMMGSHLKLRSKSEK